MKQERSLSGASLYARARASEIGHSTDSGLHRGKISAIHSTKALTAALDCLRFGCGLAAFAQI
jgi:hypothetical protein